MANYMARLRAEYPGLKDLDDEALLRGIKAVDYPNLDDETFRKGIELQYSDPAPAEKKGLLRSAWDALDTLPGPAGVVKAAANIPVEAAKDVAALPRLPVDLTKSVMASQRLDDLDDVSYADLRKKGVPAATARKMVQEHIKELEERSSKLQESAKSGQEQATRTAALAAGTLAGGGAGALAGKAAVRSLAKHAVTGAASGAAGGGVDASVRAAGLGESPEEVIKQAILGMLVGGGTGAVLGHAFPGAPAAAAATPEVPRLGGMQSYADEVRPTSMAPEPNVIGESVLPPDSGAPPVDPAFLVGGMPGTKPLARIPTDVEQLDLLAPQQTTFLGPPGEAPVPTRPLTSKKLGIERFPAFKPGDVAPEARPSAPGSSIPVDPAFQPEQPAAAKGSAPLDPSTRTQQFTPRHAKIVAKLEDDPRYLDVLDDLGGGRRISHVESYQALRDAPDMTVAELATWDRSKGTGTVDVLRANALQADLIDQHFHALEVNDLDRATKVWEDLTSTQAGYHVLTGESGRSLEIQKTLKYQQQIIREIEDAKAQGIPQHELAKRISAIMKTARAKAGPRVTKRSWWNRFEEYATAAKLSAASTHIHNAEGNAFAFIQRGVEKSMEAGLIARNDPAAAQASLRYAWGTAQGFKDGSRKFLTELMADVPERVRDRIHLHGDKPIPKALRPLSPFRWLGAADAAWRTVYRDAVLHEHALAIAMREGNTGEALGRRASELYNAPNDFMKRAAEAEGLEYTFQDNPGAAVTRVAEIVHKYVPFGRIIMPFISTPANLTRFYLRRGPLGLVPVWSKGGWRLSQQAQRLKGTPKERATALAQVSTGTLLTLGVWSALDRVEYTGAYPKDNHEKEIWRAEGKRPYSIRIGDRWWQYNRTAPIGLYISQVAAARALAGSGKDSKAEKKLAAAVVTAMHGVTDMAWLQGLQDLQDAWNDPDRSAEKFFANTVTGLIPNAMRDIRNQTDNVVRRPRGVAQSIQNMLPGLSQNVPARRDIIGELGTLDPNRLVRVLKTANIAKREHEQELKALGETRLTSPKLQLTFNGVTLPVEGPDADLLAHDLGVATLRAAQSVSRSKAFWDLPPETRAATLSARVAKQRDAVREEWTRKYAPQFREALGQKRSLAKRTN